MTGDESWFFHKQIGRKSSNVAWVARGDPPPTMVRHNRFAPRSFLCIFFKPISSLLIHSVRHGQTIDHDYYIDNCLRPVIDEVKKPKTFLGYSID